MSMRRRHHQLADLPSASWGALALAVAVLSSLAQTLVCQGPLQLRGRASEVPGVAMAARPHRWSIESCGQFNRVGQSRVGFRPHRSVARQQSTSLYSAGDATQEGKLVVPAPLEWLDVVDGPAVEPRSDSTVMPIFPLTAIEWPGTSAQLNIIDPAYRRMYDDILLSGARRFAVVFTRSLPGGRVRYTEMSPEDRRLHAIGSILYLEDLQEVSERTDGVVKYTTSHSIRGRVRLLRLLNPNALFKTDENGNKVDYLRAEVEFMDDTEDSLDDGPGTEMAAELAEVWAELGGLYERADGLQVTAGRGLDAERLAGASTWTLAEVWQQTQYSVRVQREQMRVVREVRAWVQDQQEQGLLPSELPKRLDVEQLGLPAPLLEDLRRIGQGGAEVVGGLWEDMLGVLAAEGADVRGALLVGLAREEARLARTRIALREALSG